MDEAQARAAAAAFPVSHDLATKADLARLGGELKADLKVLKLVCGPIVIALLLKLVFFP